MVAELPVLRSTLHPESGMGSAGGSISGLEGTSTGRTAELYPSLLWRDLRSSRLLSVNWGRGWKEQIDSGTASAAPPDSKCW